MTILLNRFPSANENQMISHYAEEISHIPSLTETEEQELLARLGVAFATSPGQPLVEPIRRRLVEGCLGLVVYLARHYHQRFRRLPTRLLSLDDLIQEGNEGLLRASHQFVRPEFERRRFSPYAGAWIEGAIRQALVADTPVKGCYAILRLDAPLFEGEQTLADTLALPTDGASCEQEHEQERQQVARLLARLPERARAVIQLRYGIDHQEVQAVTKADASQMLGVSHSTVRQIEQRALRRMATDPGELRIGYGSDAHLRETLQRERLQAAYRQMAEEGANLTVHALAKRAHTSVPTASAFLRELPEWGSDEERLHRASQRLAAAGVASPSVQQLSREAKVQGQVAARYLDLHVLGSVQERLLAAFQQLCSEEGPITLKRLVQLAHCQEQPAREFLRERGLLRPRGRGGKMVLSLDTSGGLKAGDACV